MFTVNHQKLSIMTNTTVVISVLRLFPASIWFLQLLPMGWIISDYITTKLLSGGHLEENGHNESQLVWYGLHLFIKGLKPMCIYNCVVLHYKGAKTLYGIFLICMTIEHIIDKYSPNCNTNVFFNWYNLNINYVWWKETPKKCCNVFVYNIITQRTN